MTNIDVLNKAVETSFGNDATILDSTDSKVIIRFLKGDRVEYAVLSHDYNTVFNGNYYTTMNQSQDKARNLAWEKYESYRQ